LRGKFVVPVLLGNALPRPDGSDEEYEHYCRSMLLLFKPWRILRELKDNMSTWTEAFENETFAPDLQTIIGNVNVEHECKDARDAHAQTVREQHAKPHAY
ncbi:hypothetical protein BD769DRAFT_1318493, partial [Suillus cothurnatus]